MQRGGLEKPLSGLLQWGPAKQSHLFLYLIAEKGRVPIQSIQDRNSKDSRTRPSASRTFLKTSSRKTGGGQGKTPLEKIVCRLSFRHFHWINVRGIERAGMFSIGKIAGILTPGLDPKDKSVFQRMTHKVKTKILLPSIPEPE